jgi:hypothetical protein
MNDLNPHQFGDQLTLFNAPLGQPEAGTFKGNPHARLYRTIEVPSRLSTPEEVLQFASRPGKDGGHDRSLGIHWQHDIDVASDHGAHWNGNEDSKKVILEADHPGHDHVVDNSPTWHGGPPEEAINHRGRNKLSGYPKDWALIHDTVGPHTLDTAMLAEVPVRPGAPMKVHAVHMPESDEYGAPHVRNPVQFKGMA